MTDKPGTTDTTWVPKIVPMVAPGLSTTAKAVDDALMLVPVVTSTPANETVPLTTALTDKPGTTETSPVPDRETEPLTVTVPLTKADPVNDTTVVPAPAVTVPVTTTGNAVVDWPPTSHIAMPVWLMDGTAVVWLILRTVTVPLTKADPVKLTTVVPAPAVTVPVTTTGKAVVD